MRNILAIFLDKLPHVLDEEQKKNKVKINLQALRKSRKIEPERRTWHLSKTKKVQTKLDKFLDEARRKEQIKKGYSEAELCWD